MAWWHAVPRPPQDKPPRVIDRRSRLQWLLDMGLKPDMPALNAALQPFIAMLFEAGPTSVAGQGAIPLTWADLEAWQQGIGVRLPPWQLRLLRRLSAEYLAEFNQADDPEAQPPWERQSIPKWKRLQASIGALAKL